VLLPPIRTPTSSGVDYSPILQMRKQNWGIDLGPRIAQLPGDGVKA
jgi:hypothetical protein